MSHDYPARRGTSTPPEPDGPAVPGAVESYLICDAEKGELRWTATRGKARAGALAGSTAANGYQYIKLQGKGYLAHRVIWFFAHGVWPSGSLDHINGDRSDNRIANLREVSARGNAENMRRPGRANTSGFLGVSRVKESNRWLATIRANGRSISLGYFGTPEEAHATYVQAKRRLHAGCTI